MPQTRNPPVAPSPDAARLAAHLAGKPGAVVAPGPDAAYKVKGKMFAILSVRATSSLNLKCDPHLIEVLKDQYAAVGHRGHLDRRFWIAITLGADVPIDEIERLADSSYAIVCASLTRKERAELAAQG